MRIRRLPESTSHFDPSYTDSGFRLVLWLFGFSITAVLLLAPSVKGTETFRLLGRWVLEAGEATNFPPEPNSRQQGLQTSGLSYDGQFLWSIGDQRSVFPSTIVRIDPESGLLQEPFFPLRLTEESSGKVPVRLEKGNPDFEGLVVTDETPQRFFAVIESDGCYVVEGILDHTRFEARVTRVLSIHFQPAPEDGDVNSRLEGIAINDGEVWLAYERDGENVPHLYRGLLPANSVEFTVETVSLPLDNLPDRPNKGRLNFNGLDIHKDGSLVVVIVLRDQERVLFFRPDTGILSFLDVDFRSPDGLPLKWTSPEGIAIDSVKDRLWLISDPDSQRGNYRLERDSRATGNFKSMVPLLFEASLSEALRSAQRVH